MLKGTNTLNLILRCKEMEEKEPFRRNRFRKDILEEYVRTIRKCLKASGGMADVFEEKGERRLTICWMQSE